MRRLGAAGEFIYRREGHRGTGVCMHGGAQVVRRAAVRTDERDYPRTYECTRAAPQTRLLTLRHTRKPKHRYIIHNSHILVDTSYIAVEALFCTIFLSVALSAARVQSKSPRNKVANALANALANSPTPEIYFWNINSIPQINIRNCCMFILEEILLTSLRGWH